jgi:hypothetical protein
MLLGKAQAISCAAFHAYFKLLSLNIVVDRTCFNFCTKFKSVIQLCSQF